MRHARSRPRVWDRLPEPGANFSLTGDDDDGETIGQQKKDEL
jgi:hypothetical protein